MAFKDYYKNLLFGDDRIRKLIQVNYEFLDTIDFIPYFEKYNDLNDVIDALESIYDDSLKLPENLQNFIYEISYALA